MSYMKYIKSINRCILSVICCLICSLTVAAEAPDSVVGATTVDLNQALDLYQQGAVFIDVRDKLSWNIGHIDGAVHLDFNQDEFVILYVSDALDKSTPIVFYCDSPLSATGAMASFFAASWGYDNVYYFREGYYSWLASDMPASLLGVEKDGEQIAKHNSENITVAENRL